jgi:predicted RNase H-like HicB family nuclease
MWLGFLVESCSVNSCSFVVEGMQNAIADLKEALRERLAVIQDEQSRRDEAKHVARLRAVSEKIDKLQAALPRPIDPQLAHYLQRRSYEKALEFLEQL